MQPGAPAALQQTDVGYWTRTGRYRLDPSISGYDCQEERTRVGRRSTSFSDPFVWTGRALQAEFE